MSFSEFSDLGRSAKSLANLYSHLMNKLARFHSHSTFLRDCRDHHLIPHGLSLNIKPRSEREAKWKKNAEEARLRLPLPLPLPLGHRDRGTRPVGPVLIEIQSCAPFQSVSGIQYQFASQ